MAVACTLLVGGQARAANANQEAWVNGDATTVSSMNIVLPDGAGICSGTMAIITIAATQKDDQEACLYGNSSGVRVARYRDEDFTIHYAISYRSEASFYELHDICTGVEGCGYSQGHDSFILQAKEVDGATHVQLLKDFSQKLVSEQKEGVTSYRLREDVVNEPYVISSYYSTGATGLSPNGEWAVIDVPLMGVVRLSMATGEARWVARATDEPMSIDTTTIAIANDGYLVAATSYTEGLLMYAVTDTCSVSLVSPHGQGCQKYRVMNSQAGVSYQDVIAPLFSDDGKRLSLYLDSTEGVRRLVVTPLIYQKLLKPRYVAFGDSFTSGEGESADSYYTPSTNTQTNKCHVSQRSYPYLIGSTWNIPTDNVACSGSTSGDIRKHVTSYIEAGHTMPSIVSVGMGGNDIDLVGKLKSCLGVDTCSWALPANRAKTIKEVKRLLPSMINALQNIQRNTVAPMFVVGYPSVINDTSSAQCRVTIGALLNHEERQYFEESLRYLNQMIEYATQFSGGTYVSIQGAFVGERLCDESQVSMNGIRLGDDIAPIPLLKSYKAIGSESFHPTPVGHSRIAEVLRQKLKGAWQRPRGVENTLTQQPGEYWGLSVDINEAIATQIFDSTMIEDQIEAGAAQTLTVPKGTFQPGATVDIELHSTPARLTSVVAAQDGSLSTRVTVSFGTEGYHTVHVIGKTPSLEPVDIYKVIEVLPPTNRSGTDAVNHMESDSMKTPNAIDTVMREGVGITNNTLSQGFSPNGHVSLGNSGSLTNAQVLHRRVITGLVLAVVVLLGVIVAVIIFIKRRKV